MRLAPDRASQKRLILVHIEIEKAVIVAHAPFRGGLSMELDSSLSWMDLTLTPGIAARLATESGREVSGVPGNVTQPVSFGRRRDRTASDAGQGGPYPGNATGDG